MRRPLLLVAAVTLAACGGSTTESQPASPYNIAVTTSGHSGGGGVSTYVANVTLQVTDTGTNLPHQGVGVTLQVDGGQITSPLPNITGANGLTNVTWSIDTSFQHPGRSYTLAFCAVPPGRTFCKTSLIGPDVITAGPF
jgi:transcription elongation factor